MAVKNTTPEAFDEEVEGKKAPTKEEIKEDVLDNESEILAGLLELADSKNNPENYETIEIRRHGKVCLTFRLRPISETEINTCRKRATRYAKAKPGKRKEELETDLPQMRSLIIYTATVDEDRKKIWDNPTMKQKLNIIEGHDMIDAVLLGGEKDRVFETIDKLNGYTEDLEETAKN